MNTSQLIRKLFSKRVLILFIFSLFILPTQTFAHGGENHDENAGNTSSSSEAGSASSSGGAGFNNSSNYGSTSMSSDFFEKRSVGEDNTGGSAEPSRDNHLHAPIIVHGSPWDPENQAVNDEINALSFKNDYSPGSVRIRKR